MLHRNTNAVADVLIIGGSHAGLSAALTLYRALHTCIIFDSDKPRNSYGTAVRLTPTWENQDPEAFKRAARKELSASGYTRFVDGEVQRVKTTDDGLFKATDSAGEEWLGRKILLATGSKDIFPPIPGYDALYARGIFQCMFQFGFEQKGCESAGLLAVEGLANVFHSTMLADDGNKFADTMTIYTDSNASLASEITTALQTPDIVVDDRKIKALTQGVVGSEVIIMFEDGTEKREAFLVHRPNTELDMTLVDQLGLRVSDRGDIEVAAPFCQTNVPGVYAAGDCSTPAKIIPSAIASGAYAACGIARELPNRVARVSVVLKGEM